MNSICTIPVSVGELFDKFSILEIKKEKIIDENKLKCINTEIIALEPFINSYSSFVSNDIYCNLKRINEELWDIEDKIRIKEEKTEFDNEFINLARLVYITNDKRFKAKNYINLLVGSEIKEMKSYV